MEVTHLVPDEQGNIAWPDFGKEIRTVIAVGNFDGVHLGHQAVLKRTHELAVKHHAKSIAILFDPRPAVVFHYVRSHEGNELPVDQTYADPAAISTLDQRLRMIAQCGIEHAFVVRYTLAFGHISYQYFLGMLVGKLGMRTLVLGKDACIGKDRAGTVSAIDLVAQATRTFELEVVDDRGPGSHRIPVLRRMSPQVRSQAIAAFGALLRQPKSVTKAEKRAITKQFDNTTVRTWSSSFVRFALECGAVEQAATVLGRPYAIEGVVVHGKQRGRDMGYPTANITESIPAVVPGDGVYAGWITDLGPEGEHAYAQHNAQTQVDTDAYTPAKRYPAAISVGTNPTFAAEDGIIPRVIESYAITDQWLELYDHRVRVEFTHFLAPMVAFDSVDQLVAALDGFKQQTLQLLGQ